MAYSTDLCGAKLRSKLGATLNESAAAPPSSFARRQMEKMGWKEGEGLGARKNGIVTHIRVRKRKDEQGLGHEKVQISEASDQWWSSSVSDTLLKLQRQKDSEKKKNKKGKRKRRKDDGSDDGGVSPSIAVVKHYTDDELFVATGGARFGMRAQRRATAKWARTEGRSSEFVAMEAQAKRSMEWNGTGSAKLVLETKTACKVRNIDLSEKIFSDYDMDEIDKKGTNNKKAKKTKKKTKKK